MRASERFDQFGAAVQESLTIYRAALTERNVALLLTAGFVSEIGDWFNIVALVSLSFRFSESAFGVGAMLALRMLTRLMCQGPAGAFVDRHAGRRLLFVSQLVMAVIASAFAILASFPTLGLLYLLVVLLEAANCVARPAFMVELRAAAPEEQRAAANGAFFASTTTAQLAGPLLGAVVLAPFGAAAVFALNGLTFLAVALAVIMLRGGLAAGVKPRQGEIAHQAPARAEGDGKGYAWLLRRQDLGFYALVCLSLSLLVQATIALFVVRANTFGLGDGGVGLFYAAVAIGSIGGSVVAGASGRLPKPLLAAAVAMASCAIALAGFGLTDSARLAIATLVIAGFATDYYEVVGLTYFQHSIPEALYGRFFSVFLLALSAGGLIGALTGPILEQILGVGVSLAALAVPAVILAIVLGSLANAWHTVERKRGD